MSTEVETSLDISETVRDSSASVGMTKKPGAFTIIELLVVISIIIILAGLILSTVGYVQKKGARSRAEAEIAAMSAALESYKADNGIYPRDTIKTDQVDPAISPIPTTATQFLYEQLSGNSATNLQPISGAKSYFALKPQMLFGTKDSNVNLTSVSYIRGSIVKSNTACDALGATGRVGTINFVDTRPRASMCDGSMPKASTKYCFMLSARRWLRSRLYS